MSLLKPVAGKTRIKICGLTTELDIQTALDLQIDAVGLVFYVPSPRYIQPMRAGQIMAESKGLVQHVGLVVDPTDELVDEITKHCQIDIWQFHGNESAARCQQIAGTTPWIKAARIDENFQLDEFCLQYRDAHAWLLDAVVEGYGGGGKTFNWEFIPSVWIKENAHRVVLSGGLSAANVADAIHHFRPLAVDVSSGVEISKGQKDPVLMKNFVTQVRSTDLP
jgi:phosphoribosylanthranilate isomerase